MNKIGEQEIRRVAEPYINRYARIHSAWTCWYIPRTR